jgi:hypothetical protein
VSGILPQDATILHHSMTLHVGDTPPEIGRKHIFRGGVDVFTKNIQEMRYKITSFTLCNDASM